MPPRAWAFNLTSSQTKRETSIHARLYIKKTLLATFITGRISLFNRLGVALPAKNQS